VKLTNFKTVPNAGALIARFDIEFKPLIVRGMSIFRRDNGGVFISEPSEKYERKVDGVTQYYKHVVITDDEIKGQIAALAKQKLAEIEGVDPDSEIPF